MGRPIAKVEILPAIKSENMGQLFLYQNGDMKYSRTSRSDGNRGNYFSPQHLYIHSDEPIFKGDWMIGIGKENHMNKVICPEDTIVTHEVVWRRIIVSTDPTLFTFGEDLTVKMQKPSIEFIDKFCELGGVDEVEYVRHVKLCPVGASICSFPHCFCPREGRVQFKLDNQWM